MTMNGNPEVTFVFTEVLNHNQQGKRMFVCTDAIQNGASLLHSSNGEISPSEPQPTGVDYAPLAGRTAIGIFPEGSGVEGGYIMMPLNREYTLPFDVKVVTDRQNITATNSTMRKTDDGFVFSITSHPGGYDQTVSFKIADSDPSMKLRLEFPDGNVKEYTPY